MFDQVDVEVIEEEEVEVNDVFVNHSSYLSKIAR
jgi:hypothetical protein